MNKIIKCLLTASLVFSLSLGVKAAASEGGIKNWDEVHYCYATRTETGYTEGCHALLYPINEEILVTAAAPEFYNAYGINASLAGAYLEVTAKDGRKVNVLVSDEAPAGSLDLYTKAFDMIADPRDGRIDINWRIIKRPLDCNFTYAIKDGSSPYWAGIQVRDHKYPIIKMEFYKDDKWNDMQKQTYNFFTASNIGKGYTFVRVTDIRGKSVIDRVNIPLITDKIYLQKGSAQCQD